jgi:hypothetical protein
VHHRWHGDRLYGAFSQCNFIYKCEQLIWILLHTLQKLKISSTNTFLFNSSWYLFVLQDTLNYFSVIFVLKTNIWQNIPVTNTKSEWILMERTQVPDRWSIWNLFHSINLLLWDIKNHKNYHPWLSKHARFDAFAYYIFNIFTKYVLCNKT